MSHCEVTQLQSKLEVIEALQSLLDHTRTLDLGDVLQTEWQTIQNHLSAVLPPLEKRVGTTI